MLKKIVLTLSLSLLAFAENNASKEVIVEFLNDNDPSLYTTEGIYIEYLQEDLTIEDLDKISYVNLDNKRLEYLPSEIKFLTNLDSIALTNNEIETLPIEFYDLTKLEWLYLNNNLLKELAPEIGNLINLKNIEANGNQLKTLPKEISELVNLEWLDLNNNEIEQLPTSIGNLENLTSLSLNNNRLKKLPKELYNLSLSSLGLDNNFIKELPPEIGNLINLGALSLENNQLKTLPNEIGNLTNLGYLNLSNNELTSIDENISNITTLLRLKLENNKLKTLPKGVGSSKNLIEVDVSNNDLRELPKEIGNICSYAREFKYPYRKVNRGAPPLPECIIDVKNNKLSYLPQEIAKIKYLPCNGIEFDGNYFDKLPISFKRIKFGLLFPSADTGYQINCGTPNSFEKLGYEFYSLLINYSFEDNKTISFKPILGDDFNITSYLWTFGDGNNSTEKNPTHTYLNYGDYNVTLNLNSGELNASKLITLYPRVLELKKGWNMITPPSKDDINATLFEIVWSYQNEIWDNNHSYLSPTIGYWVKLNKDLNYSYSGEIYKLPNYKIKEGWNLIGSGEKYFREKNQTIYQFKNGEWEVDPNEIKVGQGFWMKEE